MRYFLDEEFIEDGKTIDLVSIALVAEDGREYYAQNLHFDADKASEWVQQNVLPQLKICREVPLIFVGDEPDWASWRAAHGLARIVGCPCTASDCPWRTRERIRDDMLAFVDSNLYGAPQFWGYYADYDWVALCQLFGTMMDLPKGWPMYCRDLKQWADMLGNPRLPEQPEGEHHALQDARWNARAYDFLVLHKIGLWHLAR